MKRYIVASNNAHKIAEIASILGEDFELIPQAELGIPSVPETGLSFVENAIIKARHASQASGMAAISDDSGIEVDALQGRPGIYSARYAGEHASDSDNNRKLLEELNGVTDRRARYQCVIVCMRHAGDPVPVIAQGSWEGLILVKPRGSGGFGYDPLMYIPTHDSSVAELSAEQKNRLSHRSKALSELSRQMND